jgi:hypothetical protein
VGEARDDTDGYWAEDEIVAFVERQQSAQGGHAGAPLQSALV